MSIVVDDHDRRLAEALAVAGYPRSVIDMARKGHWSDFKSPLAVPKMELVKMLRLDNQGELAKRVEAGEFDG